MHRYQFSSGVEEESDGNCEEVDCSHGQGRGIVLSR